MLQTINRYDPHQQALAMKSRALGWARTTWLLVALLLPGPAEHRR
jgi:hypothetical protein